MADTFSIDDVEVIRDSGKALLVRLEDVGDDVWVPKSALDASNDVWEEGDVGTLVVEGWLARKESW